MTTETRAAFARRLGFDRSRITQLAGQGRVVLTPDGKLIEVEASLARMVATADPGRMDVVERHAAERASKCRAPAAAPPPAPELSGDSLGIDPSGRARAKALRMHYENSTLKLEMGLRRGLRYERAAVRRESGSLRAMLRAVIERVIDQTAPRLAAASNDMERRIILDQEIRRLRWMMKREMPRALRRMKDAGNSGKKQGENTWLHATCANWPNN